MRMLVCRLGPVMDYLGTTGIDSLAGADMLKIAPRSIAPRSPIRVPRCHKLKGVAQVHLADLGTRIFYLDHGSFRYACQPARRACESCGKRSLRVSRLSLPICGRTIAADNVLMLALHGVGRRVHDNGSGTDHGAVAWPLPSVILCGGQYSEYPSLS